MILFLDEKSEVAFLCIVYLLLSRLCKGVNVLVYTHQMTKKRIIFHFITMILMIFEQY